MYRMEGKDYFSIMGYLPGNQRLGEGLRGSGGLLPVLFPPRKQTPSASESGGQPFPTPPPKSILPRMILRKPLVGKPLEDEKLEKLWPILKFLATYHRYQVDGFERIPKRGRALVVTNHSLATYDLLLLGAAILRQHRRHPVALGDRKLFALPWMAKWMTRIGVVEGNPKNAETALRDGKLVIVAPGGMKEAIRPSTQKRRIVWKNRKGFAQLAIRTQAPVILAACPKADDLYNVLPNPLTKLLYRKLRIPFVVMKGWGPTLLPKPVKLVHHISEKIRPPRWKEGDPRFEEKVDRFHDRVSKAMEELLAKTGKKTGSPFA